MQNLTKRNLVTLILLSIITCGIYGIIVMYQMIDEMEKQGAAPVLPAIGIVLLSLFVGPVGGALFGYSANQQINKIKENEGRETTDNMILWTVLGVIYPIIALILVQNEINKY